MWLLQACRGCLTTEGKLANVGNSFWCAYEAITGIKLNSSDGLPTMLCTECRCMLKKFIAYRRKWRRANLQLNQIMAVKGKVSSASIRSVDRTKNRLQSSLGPWNANTAVCYTITEHIMFTVTNRSEPETDGSKIQHTVDIKPCDVEINNEYDVLEQNNGSNDADDENRNVDLNDVFADLQTDLFDGDAACDVDNDDGDVAQDVVADVDETLTESVEGIANEEVAKEENIQKADGAGFFNRKDLRVRPLSLSLENCSSISPMSVEEQKQGLTERLKTMRYVAATYKCSICVTTFSSMADLNEHALRHKLNQGEFKCDVCCFSSKLDSDLQFHRASNHLYKFTCRHCSVIFTGSRDLEQHIFKEHMKAIRERIAAPFNQIIQKIPKTPEEMYVPNLKVKIRPEGSNWCNVCNRELRARMRDKGLGAEYYTRHMKKHEMPTTSDPDKLMCDICKCWFTGRTNLVKHMSTHTTKYKCKLCKVQFFHRSGAYKHVNKKHENFGCEFCDKTFVSEYLLFRHTRSAHKQLGRLVCSICAEYDCVRGRTYYSHQLTKHGYFAPPLAPVLNEGSPELVHSITDDVPKKIHRVCTKCKKTFEDRESMLAHFKQCHKTKCPYCSYECRARLHLHVRNVHPHLPYPFKGETTLCDTCGKLVSVQMSAYHRRQHQRLHHVEEAAKGAGGCPRCEYKNSKPVVLLQHIVRHHVARPWRCAVCRAGFNVKEQCKNHIAIHHGGTRPYACDICPKKLSAFSKLKDHYKHRHSLEYEKTSRKSRVIKENYNRLIVFAHMFLDLRELNNPTGETFFTRYRQYSYWRLEYLKEVPVEIWDYYSNTIGQPSNKFNYIMISQADTLGIKTTSDIYKCISNAEIKRRKKLKIDVNGDFDIENPPDYTPLIPAQDRAEEERIARKRAAEIAAFNEKGVKKRKRRTKKEIQEALQKNIPLVVKRRKRKLPVADEMQPSIEINEPAIEKHGSTVEMHESNVVIDGNYSVPLVVGNDGSQYVMLEDAMY